MERFCTNCGAKVEGNAAVCPNCGAPMAPTASTNSKYCRHCGAQINVDAVVCPHCGRQVEKLQSETPQQQPQIVINNSSNANSAAGGWGMNPAYPYKSKTVALLLCFFLGVFGVHRFYVGKIGTGLLWLFTGGLCGVGALIDFIMILVGSFRDQANMPLQ